MRQRTAKPTIRRVTRKNADQPVHPTSMATVPLSLSFNRPEAVACTCDQRILWLDYADAQADLSLRWSHKSYCRFYRALVPICTMIGRLFTTTTWHLTTALVKSNKTYNGWSWKTRHIREQCSESRFYWDSSFAAMRHIYALTKNRKKKTKNKTKQKK